MSQSLIFPEEYSNASPLKHFNTFSVSQYLTDNNYTQQSSYIPRFSDDEASNDAELDAVQSYDIDSQQWAPNGSNPADDSLYALSGNVVVVVTQQSHKSNGRKKKTIDCAALSQA